MMTPNPHRYDIMPYRRCGSSGLMLPRISLGVWQGFAGYTPDEVSRRMIFTAFDQGITHFDLANNYGGKPGDSEILFGRILSNLPRDEVVVSSKAGFRMWPGPFGDGGSRKSMIASCDQSLKRLGVDYVDIFYSHRPDPDVPVEETLDALEAIVRQGKALHVGISNYHDEDFTRAVQANRSRKASPIIVNQTFYSMLDRAPETRVLPIAAREGIGVIAYSPHVQGILTDRYRAGIPSDSRIGSRAGNGSLSEDWITPELRAVVDRLHGLARARPVPGADVLGMVAAASPSDLGADRSQQAGAAHGLHRVPWESRIFDRRIGGHRQHPVHAAALRRPFGVQMALAKAHIHPSQPSFLPWSRSTKHPISGHAPASSSWTIRSRRITGGSRCKP